MNILNLSRRASIESITAHVDSITEETKHRIDLHTREQVQKIYDGLDSAFNHIKPIIPNMASQAMQKLQELREPNKEKIDDAQENVAWATINRVGTGRLARTSLITEVAVESVSLLAKIEPPSIPQRWSFKNMLNKAHFKLPNWSMFKFGGLSDGHFSDKKYDSFSLNYPDIPEMELPELHVSQTPNFSVPSLPQHRLVEMASNRVVDQTVEIAVDAEKEALERLISDPYKEGVAQIQERINYLDEDEREFLDAAQVIIHRRTAPCRGYWETITSCLRNSATRVHRFMLENIGRCCFRAR